MTKRIKQFRNCTPVTVCVPVHPYMKLYESQVYMSVVAAHVAVYNLTYGTSQDGQ